MRILITGGAGYIGTELAEHLANLPVVSEVLVYDNLSRSNYNIFLGNRIHSGDKIVFVQGDILDAWSLHRALSGVDIVYHLAAKVSTPFADQGPHDFEQINHWGTSEVVNAIEKQGIKTSVFLSSASVYGATTEEVDETQAPNPQTFYGISKANAESHFARLFDRCQSYTIRCGNVYGYSRSMRFDSVINKFMFNANFTGRINIDGDGHQVRSFANVATVAAILSKLPFSNLASGVYNLVEKTYSVNQIVEVLKTLYPDLEQIFVNRNIKLRELQVLPNPQVNSLLGSHAESLESTLKNFKSSFSF